jgi:quercetin dioxygenase-like cupin family protein
VSDVKAKILNILDAAPFEISSGGASGVTGLPLLLLSEGTGEFDIRGVRVAPGGITPNHIHAWPQANYILTGYGTLALDEVVHDVRIGDFVYVPPNVKHVFTNTGEDDLVMLAVRGSGSNDVPEA